LDTEPLSSILAKLLEDDERMEREAPDLPFTRDEAARLMTSRTEYLTLYGALKGFPLAVSGETGRLLYMLARAVGAKNMVEFGASTGVSSLFLAAALRDNGGGLLITTEFEPSKVEAAGRAFKRSGLGGLIELRAGDAMKTLADGLPSPVDILFLDGAKAIYPDILDLVEKNLRSGSLVLADDADRSPDYLKRVRSAGSGYMSVRAAEGVELSLRL
jgi:predicted O-methyltransferase YrrM